MTIDQLEIGRQGVQRDVIDTYERLACLVVRVPQSYRRGSRRSPGTPGIPDLYVFPPIRASGAAPWWHETKRQEGKQRPAQISFETRCKASHVGYVLGGVPEALAHLRAIGLVR